jgi:hypothetical protein
MRDHTTSGIAAAAALVDDGCCGGGGQQGPGREAGLRARSPQHPAGGLQVVTWLNGPRLGPLRCLPAARCLQVRAAGRAVASAPLPSLVAAAASPAAPSPLLYSAPGLVVAAPRGAVVARAAATEAAPAEETFTYQAEVSRASAPSRRAAHLGAIEL